MIFEDVQHALSWYVSRADESYSPLGAICIGLDAGVDISTENDGFDDVDTMCDIENILISCITKLERRVIIYHTIFGFADSMIDGKRVKGSFAKFKHKITPLSRIEDKVIREKDKFNSRSFFINFVNSIERTIELKLIEAGYIVFNTYPDDFFED